MTRGPAATLLTAALLLCFPTATAAAPLLEQADAEELAQALAEATDEQGVCYGWEVQVQDESGGPGGLEAGSSRGPGRPLDRAGCASYAVLRAGLVYTSELSESEDSVSSFGIDSNLPRPPTTHQLAELGYDEGSLLSENDDQAVIDMAGVLPLLVAEAGLAPYVPFEARSEPIPAADRPTDSPSSDWWRNYWWVAALGALGVVVVLVLTGAAVIAVLRGRTATSGPNQRGEATP